MALTPELGAAEPPPDLTEAGLRRELLQPAGRPAAARELARLFFNEGRIWLGELAAGLAAAGHGQTDPAAGGPQLSAAAAVALLTGNDDPSLTQACEDYARRLAEVEANTHPSGLTSDDLAELAGPLLGAGVAPEFLAVFDNQYYWNAHPSVREDLASDERKSCLRHFLSAGVHQGLATSYDAFLDVDFYRETYPSAAGAPAATRWRWISHGVAAGHKPNRLMWARAAGLTALRSVSDLDLVRVCAAHLPASADPTWAACLAHVLAGGPVDLEWLPRLDASGAHFLLVVADHLEAAGRSGPAAALYECAYARSDQPSARLRYAALLSRSGRWTLAADLYEAVEDGATDLDAALDLARCHERLGRWEQALEAALRAAARFGEDPRARSALHAACGRCLSASWRRAHASLRFDVEAAQALLTEGCRLVYEALAPQSRLPRRAISRVAIVAEMTLPQCRFYRVEQKLQQLAGLGIATTVFDLAYGGACGFTSQADSFDAVIFYRAHANIDTLTALTTAEAFGVHTFYEIDDLTFDASVFPPPLPTYGGLITAEQHAGLQMAAPLQAFLLERCGHGVASTTAIAAAMSGRNASVFVHQNGLDDRHVAASRTDLARVSTGLVTIFCGSASAAHSADAAELLELAVERLTAPGAPPVFFVLAGDVSPPASLLRRPDLYVRAPAFEDITLYWRRLRQADINLAPLPSTRVTDGKSAIKWLEAAMFGVPTVAGPTATYAALIESGVTGVIARTPQEWSDALWSLIVSEHDRQRIGEAARLKAQDVFSAEKLRTNLAEIFAAVAPASSPDLPTVTLVNVFYPPQAKGGATRVVHDNAKDVAEGLSGRASIEIFCTRETDEHVALHTREAYVQDGLRVTTVSTSSDRRADLVYDDVRMEVAFDAYLQARRPSVVHFHCLQRLGVGLCRAAIRRGIPYLITFHDAWWISSEQFFLDGSCGARPYDFDLPARTLVRDGPVAFERLVALAPVIRGATKLLAVSEPFAALARATGLRSVVALPNGVSQLPPARDRSARVASTVVVGFLGGVSLHKGFHLFRLAVLRARLKRVSVVVIDHGLPQGDGYAERWGETPVTFRSRTPQQEVGSLYANLDVLVAPSIWPESYGLVAREARSLGVWVVASDRGDIAGDVTPGVDGFIVSVDDPGPLAEALERIDADPERFARSPPPGRPLRTARDQASNLQRIYLSMLPNQP